MSRGRLWLSRVGAWAMAARSLLGSMRGRLAAGAGLGAAATQFYAAVAPSPAHAAASGEARSSSSSPTTFYSSWFCPFAQRVWIALEEKNVQYEYVEINPYEAGVGGRSTKKALPLEEKRRRYPDFVAASPRGLVPALAHEGSTVCDSLVMVEYLEDRWPHASPLLPEAPADRARARQWSSFAGANIIPKYYQLLMAQKPEAQEQARAQALDGLRTWVGAMHPTGPYFLGERFSYADVALWPWVERFLTVGAAYRQFRLPDAPEFERLRAWHAAVKRRPAVARTLADETRLVENYSEYADNSATSDAARRFRGAGG